ncbi:MAG: sigma-70 family RNA polymerase sigma factor [Verrucomicrobia bacterium]|nr:sigma-70 family RNA polymerase sigma factor [Verrucomicrobiota bacterium]MDE3098708.1 sigma-70 family RNA polymerase sigma factor [Verrucomicrobiota bacterium]
MKTPRNRIFRFKTARLAPSRGRLRPPRLSSRLRNQPAPTGPIEAVETPRVEPPPPSSEPLHADAFQLYLREIGRVKLLTPDEELALAKRIRKGDKQAREHMINANLRLVVKIAREYEGLGLPLLDLINEGNIGLMKGVDRFDTAKGAKLSTYASWWIKQSIRRALANQSKTIRLPVHVVDTLAHVRKAEARLHDTLGREPTDSDVADELHLDPRRIRRYRQASRAPVSLDSPVGDEDSPSVSDVVADANAATPSDHLAMRVDREMVRRVLGTLNPRESAILAMRFGLDQGEGRTLEELGKKFGVTRERIRQIQEEALRKLRTTIEKLDRPIPT